MRGTSRGLGRAARLAHALVFVYASRRMEAMPSVHLRIDRGRVSTTPRFRLTRCFVPA